MTFANEFNSSPLQPEGVQLPIHLDSTVSTLRSSGGFAKGKPITGHAWISGYRSWEGILFTRYNTANICVMTFVQLTSCHPSLRSNPYNQTMRSEFFRAQLLNRHFVHPSHISSQAWQPSWNARFPHHSGFLKQLWLESTPHLMHLAAGHWKAEGYTGVSSESTKTSKAARPLISQLSPLIPLCVKLS